MIHAHTPQDEPDAILWAEAALRTPAIYIVETDSLPFHTTYRAAIFAQKDTGAVLPTLFDGSLTPHDLKIPFHELIAYSDPLPTSQEASRLIIAWCIAQNISLHQLPFHTAPIPPRTLQ